MIALKANASPLSLERFAAAVSPLCLDLHLANRRCTSRNISSVTPTSGRNVGDRQLAHGGRGKVVRVRLPPPPGPLVLQTPAELCAVRDRWLLLFFLRSSRHGGLRSASGRATRPPPPHRNGARARVAISRSDGGLAFRAISAVDAPSPMRSATSAAACFLRAVRLASCQA